MKIIRTYVYSVIRSEKQSISKSSYHAYRYSKQLKSSDKNAFFGILKYFQFKFMATLLTMAADFCHFWMACACSLRM